MLLKAACLALGNKLGFSVTGLCFLLPEMAVYFSATVRGASVCIRIHINEYVFNFIQDIIYAFYKLVKILR